MERRSDGRVRLAVAREAARVMYEDGVSQYLQAKRIAARRILGRYRPTDLPSNGEIRDALRTLATLAEGAARDRRQFAMRVTALHLLQALATWHARLIGSVWSGHARHGSDIDVHLFADSVDHVARDLDERGWAYQAEEVLIRVGSELREYHHLHLAGWPFPVELSVYPLAERRQVTRSSVDGRPIDRVGPGRLRRRLAEDHPDQWDERWLTATSGELAALADDLETPGGEFDGLLAELRNRGSG